MNPDGFAARLAYLRWVANAGRLMPESDKALSERAGVGYEWLKKWMKRDDAPEGRTATKNLSAALNAEGDWLLDGKGQAPNALLWQIWSTARRSAGS